MIQNSLVLQFLFSNFVQSTLENMQPMIISVTVLLKSDTHPFLLCSRFSIIVHCDR